MQRSSINASEKRDVRTTPDILSTHGNSRNARSIGTKKRTPNFNADVLAKVILDTKVILEIESALVRDLDFGEDRNPRPLQDQLLL
jgi:hypothetical protein